MGWGHHSSFGSIIEVAYRGDLFLGGAFDVSLGGFCHEAFSGGMMAPPAGVRARVRPRTLYEEAMEGFYDTFDHPHELIVHGGWDRVLCHKVANGHRGIAETERKRRRGTLRGVFRR